jgi:hypothetical protein
MATLEERVTKHHAVMEHTVNALKLKPRIRAKDIRDERDPIKKAEVAIRYLEQSGHPGNKEIYAAVRAGFNLQRDKLLHIHVFSK